MLTGVLGRYNASDLCRTFTDTPQPTQHPEPTLGAKAIDLPDGQQPSASSGITATRPDSSKCSKTPFELKLSADLPRSKTGGICNALRVPRRIGYARVSTQGQSLEQQFAVLREAGCEVVFGEKISSTVPAHKRAQLQAALGALAAGDELVISKLDRLGRTQSEVVARLASLQEQGVYVRTLDGLLNTASLGKMAPLVVGLLTGLAEVERELTRERTRESVEHRSGGPVFVSPEGALHHSKSYPHKVVASMPGAGWWPCRAVLQPRGVRGERSALIRSADGPHWRRPASATGA